MHIKSDLLSEPKFTKNFTRSSPVLVLVVDSERNRYDTYCSRDAIKELDHRHMQHRITASLISRLH
jgi:hypothetical protein